MDGTPGQPAQSTLSPPLAVELRDSTVLLALCLALLGLVAGLASTLLLG